MPIETRSGRGWQSWLAAGLLALAIPIAGAVVGVAVLDRYDADLRTLVEADIGRSLTPAERAEVTIAVYCADPIAAGDTGCSDVSFARAMLALSGAGALVGLSLLVAIAVMPRWAGRSRSRMARTFTSGLYFALAGIASLAVLDGVIVLASFYLVLGVFFSLAVSPIFMGAVALGIGAGAVGVLRAMLAARRPGEVRVLGRGIRPAEEPALFGELADLSRSLGIEAPQNVVVGLDPTFFVTEADVVALDGTRFGRTVFISLPLSRVLSRAELRAIIGHELGHFHGQDTEYSRRFSPVYRGTVDAIAALAAVRGFGLLHSVTLFPSIILLGLFLDGFAQAERSIARHRELEADATGARLTTTRDMAAALVKVAAFGPLVGPAVASLASPGASRIDATPDTAGERFAELALAATTSGPDVLRSVDDAGHIHPIDSHPPIGLRLAALGVSTDELRETVLAVQPAQQIVIAGRATYERELGSWIATGATTTEDEGELEDEAGPGDDLESEAIDGWAPGPAAEPAFVFAADAPEVECCPNCDRIHLTNGRYCAGCGFDYAAVWFR